MHVCNPYSGFDSHRYSICKIISFLPIYTPPRHRLSMASIGRTDNITPHSNWRNTARFIACSGKLDDSPTDCLTWRVNEESSKGRRHTIDMRTRAISVEYDDTPY